jgi:hypothetical protein
LRHYVYRHIRLDKNTPFYVGKGGYKARANECSQRNYYWTNIYKKYGRRVEILKYFNTNEEAYAFEQKLITLYKKLGYCEANFSDGGAGRTGFKQPDYIKKIISEKNSGSNNGMWRKCGNLNPSYGSGFKVRCLNNQKEYISAEAAQNDLKITNVIKVATGFREHSYGYYFELVDDRLRLEARERRKQRYLANKRKKKTVLIELLEIYKIEELK